MSRWKFDWSFDQNKDRSVLNPATRKANLKAKRAGRMPALQGNGWRPTTREASSWLPDEANSKAKRAGGISALHGNG